MARPPGRTELMGRDDERTTMTRFARAAATAALAVTMAAAMYGCGSTEGTAATPTPIAWSPTPELYRTLTEQELAEALLDLGDMSSNYIEAPSASGWLDRKLCNDDAPHSPTVQASATHVKYRGRPGDLVRTAISQYPTTEAATASFGALAKSVQGCRQETAGGHAYRYAAAQLPAGLMYRTVAVRVTTGGITTLQGWVTAGPAVITVEMGELTPDSESRYGMTAAAYDGGRLVQLLEKQVSHYKDAAGCSTCR
jgi:hypothetical protein